MIARIMSALHFIPPWHVVKTIGGSRTVALAGFFPFFGYLILLNDHIFAYFKLIVDKLLDTDINSAQITLDRIYHIYIALFILSCGVLMYRIACPREIGKFNDRYEFFRNEIDIANPYRLSLFKEALQISSLSKYFYPDLLHKAIAECRDIKLDNLKITAIGYPDIGDNNKSFETWLNDSKISFSLLLNTYYDKKNYSLGLIRLAALFAYLIGYAMLAWPSLKTLCIIVTTQS